MYGDVTYIHRLYDGGKVAAYSIVQLDSGYRLSITGKPFTVLFPSWSAEKIQDEISPAFDIGVLVITIRHEAETTWEAVENLGMDEDEEFLSYELVETSDLVGMNDEYGVILESEAEKFLWQQAWLFELAKELASQLLTTTTIILGNKN
jgi:hypothetical protein